MDDEVYTIVVVLRLHQRYHKNSIYADNDWNCTFCLRHVFKLCNSKFK